MVSDKYNVLAAIASDEGDDGLSLVEDRNNSLNNDELRDNRSAGFTCKRWLQVMGPGMVVMLADTDAGCLVTASVTGATWGYSQIWLQLLLIPVVFMAQELTIRLGIFTGQGHGELIRDHFGKFWAWVSVITLVIACAGAVVSEMSGIVGVGRLVGIPDWVSAISTALILFLIVVSGKYRHVEKVALVLGCFEFVYFITFVMAFKWSDFSAGFFKFSFDKSDYTFLLAANIGAVVMPWMIFYQQSAVVDKKLTADDLFISRQDTCIGSFLTQFIMASVIVTTAGTIWKDAGSLYPNPNPPSEIGDFSDAISEHLGGTFGKVIYCIGMVGGALIGGIVVSLTAAWGLGEVAGYKRSLEHSLKDAPWFYAVYAGCLIVGVAICLSPVNLVVLNVVIQVMNACLLPVVLGFLYILSLTALSPHRRLKGWYMYFSGIVFGIVSLFGLVGGVYGLISM